MRDYLADAEAHLARARTTEYSVTREEEEHATQTVAAVGSLEALQRIAAALENISARAFPPAATAQAAISDQPISITDEQAGKHAAREIWGLLGGPEGAL